MSTAAGYTGPVEPEFIAAVEALLPPTATRVEVVRIVRAALALYDACEELAICDAAGGAESLRVIPEIIRTLIEQANQLPEPVERLLVGRDG